MSKKLEEVIDDGKLTDVIVKDEENKLGLVGLDDNKMAKYMDAKKNLKILFGEEGKDGIDYTMMDFVLSLPCGFFEGMSNLNSIQLFWRQFYPYLKKIADNYEALYDRYRVSIDDSEEVLATHVETDFEIKVAREFLKDKKMLQSFETKLHNMKQEIIKKQAPFKRATEDMPGAYNESR